MQITFSTAAEQYLRQRFRTRSKRARELGNYVEANAELDKIILRLWAHSAALNVRWPIQGEAKKWGTALDIAADLVQLGPEEVPV